MPSPAAQGSVTPEAPATDVRHTKGAQPSTPSPVALQMAESLKECQWGKDTEVPWR